MRIVVTGGAGFIGSHLCEHLLKEGHSVLVVDDLSSGYLSNLDAVRGRFKFFQCKVEEFDLDSVGDIDAVVHLAAQASVPLSISDFYNSSKSNLLSSLRVIEYCSLKNVPLVYASSSAIYGGLAFGSDESGEIDLLSPYATDKYVMELYAKMASKIFKLSSIGLRFFNVYGPRQDPSNPYSGVISIFADRLLREKEIYINGGAQTRDFVYVGDIVKVISSTILMASRVPSSDSFNVLTGTSISIDELADLLMSVIKTKVNKVYRELPAGDPEQSFGSVEKISDLYGIDLNEFVALEDGLSLTIDELRKERIPS